MKEGNSAAYSSFVLRMWREDQSGAWRATLRDARSGEQHNFAAVAPLMQFLEAVSAETAPPHSQNEQST